MRGENLNLCYGTEIIYEDASFFINNDEKVGIVGVNGAGKTTLFKLILKKEILNSGKITISNHKRIAYLPQEIEYLEQEKLVIDYLLEARPIKKLQKEIEEAYIEITKIADLKKQNKLLKEIGKKQELLEYYDCYNAENTLFELLDKMNVDFELLDKKLKELSGGQKSKIAFVHLLYENADILLLDEPTNHLDHDTRQYITDYLKNYHGMVLIISHDTIFLDEIVGNILYVDKNTHKINKYLGNYSTFLKKLEQEKVINEKIIEKQALEEKKLKDFILQYSNSSGKRKRIAQSREKLLAKKQKQYISKIETQKAARINIQPNNEGSKIPIKVNNISFNYPDSKLLFERLSFMIQNKERFLIVGENGVGKSTLLKLLIKQLKPNEGSIWFGNKTDIAYYSQEQEDLDLDTTILKNVDDKNFSERELRTILGSFLFFGDDVFKSVNILSPGEKARVLLAKIMLKRANLLILDEPTNHLDVETQKAIGNNFANYNGTIILVSHNPEFVEQIGIDRMLILPSGKITNYSKEKLEYYSTINNK
ncbi:MAG: ABC-F family ATP-binding cassette domain-containing protein [Firmicutes bacterium]|nr:ABC-F family ATP-binding cassette domain-containing protein [Bacillota bacterium]